MKIDMQPVRQICNHECEREREGKLQKGCGCNDNYRLVAHYLQINERIRMS